MRKGTVVELMQCLCILFVSALITHGCTSESGESSEREARAVDTPTWHRDIAPLVSRKCNVCHTRGGIAPFALTDYESAKQWSSHMATAVESGRMPPFLAQDSDKCKPQLPWTDDPRLSDREKKLLRAWADANAPEGEAKRTAPLTMPLARELAREDVALHLPEEITVHADAGDIHTCVLVDPKLTEDVYVIGRDLKVGNSAVLHHVVTYVVLPGKNADGSPRNKQQLDQALKQETGAGIGGRYPCFGSTGITTAPVETLHAWAPGGTPHLAPPDSGQPLPKDALVVMDMHYHATGLAVERDRDTYLALMISKEKPRMVSRATFWGNVDGSAETPDGDYALLKQADEDSASFFVPAGSSDHLEEMTLTYKGLPESGVRIYAIGTHMHYVGKDMWITLQHASEAGSKPAAEECLIGTPGWDYDWQRYYFYDAPLEKLPLIHNGDVMKLHCLYDNSLKNRRNAMALRDKGLHDPVDVRLGNDTLDEMCIVGMGLVFPPE